MNITNIQPLTASRSGNVWTLKATYTATFTDQEKNPPLNYIFRDAIQIRESDGPLTGRQHHRFSICQQLQSHHEFCTAHSNGCGEWR
jgi:hypothetical protein